MPIIVDKIKKKKEIVMAALSVFTKKGVKKTTISEIAIAAGIGKGTIYEYFKNKDDILQYSFTFWEEEFESLLSQVLIMNVDEIKRIEILCEGIVDFLLADEHMIDIMFEFWGSSIRTNMEENNSTFKRMYQNFRSVISSLIKAGKEKNEIKDNIHEASIASGLLALVDGLMLQYVVDKESVNLKIFFLNNVDLMLAGLQKETEKSLINEYDSLIGLLLLDK